MALGLTLLACTGEEVHIQPVLLRADPDTITSGDSTELKWSSPGGIQVMKSNFGAQAVNGSTSVSPTSTTEYSITVRLASNDIYTAKCTVQVDDPVDDGGGDDSGGDDFHKMKKHRR